MQKTSKHNEVLNYLKKNGSITSMEAIEMFGATRLSAIIFNIRKTHEVDTIDMECTDRYGRTCHFGKYVYRGEKEN